MNNKLTVAAINLGLKALANGQKITDCDPSCKLIDCPKVCDLTTCSCLADDISQLKEAKRWLLELDAAQQEKTSWQQANDLDSCIQKLYSHVAANGSDVVIVLDNSPLTVSFNPATFSDLQRLFHRQIAYLHADDIE
jgi:hypothetical protein